MAVPSYTEDLTDINLAQSTTGWAESSDGAWDDGGTPSNDTDTFINGSASVSQTMSKTTICSLIADNGSGITLPTDGAYFVWQIFLSATALDSVANGGMRTIVGSSLGDFYSFDTGGNDFGRNPYGGWQNAAVNPTVTPDDTAGTPTATEQFVGSAMNPTAAISKGNPHCVGAVRYGRGSSIFTAGGDGSADCEFDGFATQNDLVDNRWGLFQKIDGGYLFKGRMQMGTSGAKVIFTDSNVSILIDDTRKVTSDFNRVEFNHADSEVSWTNISLTSLSSTSKGHLEVVTDPTTLTMNTCVFTDMDTFVFLTSAALTSCTFRRCGQITHGGSDFESCVFEGYEGTSDTSYLTYNVNADPDGEMDNCFFTKGTASTHAIEFGASVPTSMTLRGITFSGYNATNNQTDSTLDFLDGDVDYTVNLIGCSGNISYQQPAGTGSVTLVNNPVTVAITVKSLSLGTAIVGARVLLEVTDGVNFPYQTSVTITGSGTTATVTHTSHGLATNDNIIIRGANEDEYNGAYQITVTGVNTYTYTMSESATASPATGTITSTFAIINDVTDSGGLVSDSRVYSSDQDFTGRVRKSTSSPYYKSFPITDTVDSINGYSLTVQMVDDE